MMSPESRMEVTMMKVKNLSFAYDVQGKNVIQDVNFTIPAGKVTTFMGANGSGKSTLFQLMTKNLVPKSGVVQYQNTDITQIPYKKFAKVAAIVHQNNTIASEISVEQLVSYGRTPYASAFGTLKKADYEIIEWAMELMGVYDYRTRQVTDLSGGQRQRVWIAMALAQKTDLLFLDEPTTYLDIRYQLDLLHQIEKLNKELGLTVVMVLHDINHAIYFSDHVIGLKNGEVILSGEPKKVITQESIEALYGVSLEIIERNEKKIVLNV